MLSISQVKNNILYKNIFAAHNRQKIMVKFIFITEGLRIQSSLKPRSLALIGQIAGGLISKEVIMPIRFVYV